MTGTLRVTPEKLITASTEFQEIENNIRSLSQQMIALCNSLSSCFEGEDATAYTTKFRNLEMDMNEMDARIKKDVVALQEMAKNFNAAITSNIAEAQGLKNTIYQA